jgi:fibronectin type 3 domain-containing protein
MSQQRRHRRSRAVSGRAAIRRCVIVLASVAGLLLALAATTGAQQGSDHNEPSVTLAGSLYENWIVNGAESSLVVEATDTGSGVVRLELFIDGDSAEISDHPCPGGGCALNATWTVQTGGLSDGEHALELVATDAAGNEHREQWSVFADRSDPQIDLSGSLADAADGTLLQGDHELNISSSDGDGTGVRRVEVWFDDERRAVPCSDGACVDYTFRPEPEDYTPGAHRVRVVAEDWAGNRRVRDLSVLVVDDLTPRVRLFGELAEATNLVVAGGSQSLRAVASEGDGLHPTPGITDMRIEIDEEPVDAITQPCGAGSCRLEHTVTFSADDYEDGDHQVDVSATDRDGEEAHASVTVRVDRSAPGQPERVAATPRDGEIELSWDAVDDEDVAGYVVSRADSHGGPYVRLSDELTEGTTYVDDSVTNGDTYYYVVQAQDEGGSKGAESAEVNATAGAQAPPTPTDLSAVGGLARVDLTWNSGGAGTTGYLVFRATESSPEFEQLTEDPVSGTSYADEDAEPGTRYRYVVRAVAQSGARSAASAEALAEPYAGDDDAKPVVRLSGALVQAGGDWLATGEYALQIDATEGTVAHPGSGVVGLTLRVDGSGVSEWSQECASLPCNFAHSFNFRPAEYSDGIHDLEVIATDAQGRTGSESLELRVDHDLPAKVAGVVATGRLAKVELAWDDANDADADSFAVYRSGSESGTYSKLATQDLGDTSYVDSDVEPGTEYFYTVRTIDAAGNQGPPSDPVSATPQAPAASQTPQALSATGGIYEASLQWRAVVAEDLRGYYVYRALAGSENFEQLNPRPINNARYVDDAVDPNSSYAYYVRTVDVAGHQGPPSSVSQAAVADFPQGAKPPEQPAGSFVYAQSGYSDPASLRWSSADGNTVHVTCGDCGGPGLTEFGPSLSPDGTQALYARDGALVVSDVDGSDRRPICGAGAPRCTSDPLNDVAQDPSFSADGRYAVYASGPAVWRMPLEGGAPERLASIPGWEWWSTPQFVNLTADGRRVFFVSGGQVFVAHTNGGLAREIAIPFPVRYARPSPDGRRLAVVADYLTTDGYNNLGLHVLNQDGSGLQRLVDDQVGAANWSPDGQRIIFGSFRRLAQPPAPERTQHSIESIRADGTDRRVLLAGGPYVANDPDIHHSSTTYPQGPAHAVASAPSIDIAGSTDTRVSNGESPLSLQVSAAESVTGVGMVGVTLEDQSHFEQADCSSGCPSTMTESLTVNTHGVSEGTHRARAVGRSGAGVSSSEPLQVKVDRSAPPVPRDLLTEPAQNGDAVTVSWEVDPDALLADGTSGSGVARSQYRYRTSDGSFSNWISTSEQEATVARSAASPSNADFEVRAEDSAGNTSAAAVASGFIELPGYGIVCTFERPNKGEPEEPSIRSAGGERSIEVNVVGGIDKCRGDVRSVTVKVCIEVKIPTSWAQQYATATSEAASWHYLRGENSACIDNKFVRDDMEQNGQDFRHMGLRNRRLCLAGTHPYRVHIYAHPDVPRQVDSSGEVTGPAKTLDCNEEGGWRFRARRHSGYDKTSDMLGDALTRAAGDVQPAPHFAAHHIIPAILGYPHALSLQRMGFACEIPPNGRPERNDDLDLDEDATNGVWLRGFPLREDQPEYRNLSPRLKKRGYHGRMHGDRDLAWVDRQIRQARLPNGGCRYGLARTIMHNVKKKFEKLGRKRPRQLPG